MKRERPVDRLGAGAMQHYREAGWRFTDNGYLDAGLVTGPCAGCGETTVLYGPRGNPLCPTCRANRGGEQA